MTELERFLAVAAYLVVRHGEAYTPTFERLEQELEETRRRLGNRDRARRVLAELMQKGTENEGARAVDRPQLDLAAKRLL
ncbi:hypothetical protein [Mesorhizobium sp. M1A.F.Ca.ET.072.01.1.1]|uniref:hypothetical protein n=1 Tax=Mesorhizobium sp. M1A.F.Ca.ET.072.01.1.1 TaxID=2496753 RepID=UPI001673BAEC|nr:hypothetical protein [Mesorhizobium sp. M1A.F.Ca.ET.072.01.1.1]